MANHLKCPAAPAGATPFYVPQACITLVKWEPVEGSPPAIPSGLAEANCVGCNWQPAAASCASETFHPVLQKWNFSAGNASQIP
jgi:hypothetical protein